MAHFAQVNENNIVTNVLVVPNDQEHRGSEYLSVDCGLGGNWIQTSFNETIRKNFACIGGTYDPDADVFINPKPEHQPYMVLNSETLKWEFPAPYPTDGKNYYFNEDTLNWVEVPSE
jgi:hypothetical protein